MPGYVLKTCPSNGYNDIRGIYWLQPRYNFSKNGLVDLKQRLQLSK